MGHGLEYITSSMIDGNVGLYGIFMCTGNYTATVSVTV